jgi:HSP20 family protein
MPPDQSFAAEYARSGEATLEGNRAFAAPDDTSSDYITNRHCSAYWPARLFQYKPAAMTTRYKYVVDSTLPLIHRTIRQYSLMQSAPRPHLTRIIKPTNTRKMSLLFPRLAYAPVRCTPVRHEVAPLWSLFDDTFNELQRATRQSSRRQWNPRFDVKETKEGYSLEGELPGVDQKDINIEFTDEHTLTIKGRHERSTERGQRPANIATEGDEQTAVAQDGAATPSSEASSKSSHQATVEDDVEEPANSSAGPEQSTAAEAAPKQQEVASQQPKKASEQFWYRERSVGEFTRSFSFPSRVDQEAVRASLKNGILSIVVPKAPVPESRRINIE